MDPNARPLKKTGKARIPDHLRRRALVSCDRCKKRRIRCLRQPESEACQSCQEVGITCESTLPRKTRIYGSVETLSIRYRVLDALIRGLYPDQDTNNIETLCAIAEAHDIPLPPLNEQSVTDDVFSQLPSRPSATSPQLSRDGSAGSLSAISKDEDGQCSESKVAKVVDEKLVPLPHGPSHYIGPSSSFGFVLTVRNMVAELTAALRTIQPEDERAKLASEFGGSNWSKALEPINKSEESDESALSVEDHFERQATLPPSQRRMHDGLPAFPGSVNSTALPQTSRRATVQSLLPPREVTDACVKAFFDKVHPNYLLFHQPTFQARYEYAWGQPNPLIKDVEPGWICGIFMVLVFGAQVMEDHDKAQSLQIQRHYLNLVQSRLHQLISATTLVNVQALLLLQLYQHNYTERNSAFMLLGCASRMAMALGMHREGTSGGFDGMERELRKRLWWTIYLFEQNQCAILGRPCAIDDMEVNVGFPNETMLDGGESVPPGYVEYSVLLIRLMSDIRRKIYAAPNSPTQQGEFPKIGVAIQFLLDLDSWCHSLPQALRLEYLSPNPRHRRAVLLLHIQLYHTQSLVARPFILRKVQVQLARKLGKHVRSQDLDKEEMSMSNACGTFSRKCVDLLEQLLELGMFDGVAWLDAYYVYHSVFILALDFFARPWDDRDTSEDALRKEAVRKVMDALQHVKLCPTFSILTQVSMQLSKIVGIFDVRPAAAAVEKLEVYNPYLITPQPTFSLEYGGQSSQGGVETVVNSWFSKEPVDLPWDLKEFLGVDGYVGVGPGDHYSTLPSTLGGTFHGHLPGVEESNPSMQPGMNYTQWGSLDASFEANRLMRNPSSTKPSGGMNIGDMMG